MANSVVGVIVSIGSTQDLVSKSGNAFKRRELIVMLRRFDPYTGEPVTDTENTPLFTFIGDRCADLDNFQAGQTVTVYFDLSGRKYTDAQGVTKIINDIRPYRIEAYQPKVYSAPQPAVQPQSPSSPPSGAESQPIPPQMPSAYTPQQQYGQSQQYGQPQQPAQFQHPLNSYAQPADPYKPPF